MNGSLSSAHLSRKLQVTPSNVTGIIDRLVKKGLVRREDKGRDRRVTLIALTDNGRDLCRYLSDPIEERLTKGLAGCSPEHASEIALALRSILSLVGAQDVEAGLYWENPALGCRDIGKE